MSPGSDNGGSLSSSSIILSTNAGMLSVPVETDFDTFNEQHLPIITMVYYAGVMNVWSGE